MAHAKELKRGDACPTCSGELQPAYVPTEKEFARFSDRDNPGHLPMGADTANPDQRADLGELFRCQRCGYATRFPPAPETSRTGEPSPRQAQPAALPPAARPDDGQAARSVGAGQTDAARDQAVASDDRDRAEFDAWKRQRDSQAAGQ
jgi:hypothetical protein